MFLDEALVEFTSGTGGSGAVSFHREKHVPRGGPNGADGGRGGDVILVADRNRRTLYDFSLKARFEAEHGQHAVGNKKGKNGKDVTIKVPIGTVVTDVVLHEVLADLNVEGMKYVVARGGRGGFGNLHYVSSVRQVPNFAQKGAPGETVRCKLELKLLADVGLVGLPNAGKSTLLSRISAAKPAVADYPFTTIEPNLGVVKLHDETFVVADMPGLIEGASEGRGLGHQFLRHVERTKVLIHVVDVFPIDGSDPFTNYQTIEREIQDYSPELALRPRVIALNKMDLVPAGDFHAIRDQFAATGRELFAISAATGHGLEPLLYETLRLVREAEAAQPEVPVIAPTIRDEFDQHWEVVAIEGGYEVLGRRILRMVAMTDLDNRDALRYLHRRLQRLGVIEKLREMGAEEGDTVVVGDLEFHFTDQ
ncbi:MAG TPA: GTPase ObgE [Fimbriimonadaceae bacterium]|nr:GTPase ObgE [Fimbriimonadaceae bacterium]